VQAAQRARRGAEVRVYTPTSFGRFVGFELYSIQVYGHIIKRRKDRFPTDGGDALPPRPPCAGGVWVLVW
jgi:hypothetical protein